MSIDVQKLKAVLQEAGYQVSKSDHMTPGDIKQFQDYAHLNINGMSREQVAYGLAYPSIFPKDFQEKLLSAGAISEEDLAQEPEDNSGNEPQDGTEQSDADHGDQEPEAAEADLETNPAGSETYQSQQPNQGQQGTQAVAPQQEAPEEQGKPTVQDENAAGQDQLESDEEGHSKSHITEVGSDLSDDAAKTGEHPQGTAT